MAACPTVASAHGVRFDDALGPDPLLWGLIAVAAIAYGRGVSNVWREAGRGRGIDSRAAMAFASGLALLALVLSPLAEPSTRESFAAHMVQHELLMLVAAPLLVFGRPLATFAWALPAPLRGKVAKRFAAPALRAVWRVVTSVGGATTLQLGLLFGWHVPGAFDAAVAGPWLHALQHATFLASALAFWWALAAPSARARPGVVLAALFVTMIVTGALGALLTFAQHPLYRSYADRPDALADQQLGGLVMWIPGGSAYLFAALWLAARWLVQPQRSH
jgi:putative membrane protein